jgi:enoyl-CoA hydratase
MNTTLKFHIQEDIGYLRFACDPPEKPITLDLHVFAELDDYLSKIRSQLDLIRAVIIQTESDKYFIVGANINALKTLDANTITPWVERGHSVFNHIEDLPIPVIAQVNGYALGGGLELALACDIIIASSNARFGGPEAKLGLVPGWGGTFRLAQRIGLSRAKELFFTGKIIDAQSALRIGLVNYVGEPEEQDKYLQQLIADIKVCSPLAVAEIKGLVDWSGTANRREAGEKEAASSIRCIESKDTQNRIRTFLEGK